MEPSVAWLPLGPWNVNAQLLFDDFGAVVIKSASRAAFLEVFPTIWTDFGRVLRGIWEDAVKRKTEPAS